jgi:allantoin racemase
MGDELRRLAMINSDGKAHPPLPDPDGVLTTTYDLRFRVMARTPYDHLFTELGTVDAAEAALADRSQALYIDTFGDYGADRIRAMTDVPVVGAGEASIAAAGVQLRSFSIVTVWPRSMEYLYDERLRTCTGGDRCAGVHFLSGEDELERVGRSEGVKARMIRQEGGIVDGLAALCGAAVARDGSEGVLLGCTCMSPVAVELAERCAFPVLDPSRLGLEAAFQALAGAAEPRPAHRTARHGLATEIVSAYVGHSDNGSALLDDCDVCAITNAAARPDG